MQVSWEKSAQGLVRIDVPAGPERDAFIRRIAQSTNAIEARRVTMQVQQMYTDTCEDETTQEIHQPSEPSEVLAEVPEEK